MKNIATIINKISAIIQNIVDGLLKVLHNWLNKSTGINPAVVDKKPPPLIFSTLTVAIPLTILSRVTLTSSLPSLFKSTLLEAPTVSVKLTGVDTTVIVAKLRSALAPKDVALTPDAVKTFSLQLVTVKVPNPLLLSFPLLNVTLDSIENVPGFTVVGIV